MGRDYKNKRILVVGAGLTGLALTRFFAERGASVILSDSRSADRIPVLPAHHGIALDLGGHTEKLFAEADLVVVSPGVPLSLPPLEAARAAGVAVTGEIEIAFDAIEAPLAAVTGTNGKSTTTVVMGEIFKAWGKSTFVGGNLGTPLIEAAEEGKYDWVLAELSSFQLETAEEFRPRYAALLNLSEDHLDRYESMEGYVAAKARIFRRMTAGDVAVLNAEDPLVLSAADPIMARKVLFSSRRILEEGMGYDSGEIVWRYRGVERRFPASQLRIKGEHNVENVMAAMIPPLLEGCPLELAWEAACSFGGLEHRMVLVREFEGVSWYNDSKGTNVGSVVKSLSGLRYPVTLIAGGKDKGGDYAPLARPIRERVEHLILIGEAADRMEDELGSFSRTVRAQTLEEAVLLAWRLTEKGGSVLLSPGCSSFDMFKNFGERGDLYAAAVMALEKGRKSC